MTCWKWVEDLANAGVQIAVVYDGVAWSVSIGGHFRSGPAATAAEAISEAVVSQVRAGAKAITELERTKQRIATLGQCLKGVA